MELNFAQPPITKESQKFQNDPALKNKLTYAKPEPRTWAPNHVMSRQAL